MSSQKQSSPSSYLRSQMTRAADLEAKLAALPPKSSEEKASRIRIQLCEVLSDVLLTDPQFALRKDCSGRLWRHCFYARIGELRSRIAREKRKQGPSLRKFEESLKVFLKESIVLYEYLVEKYESKLLPDVESLSQPPEGVVPGLHRILIHLGDLHRYATSYGQAEKCYEKASKLAPGKGNPYNQLAVVAQLKDPSAPLSCVALYYYARALMATKDPFETSKANLMRLLESNREWLQTASETELLAAAKGDPARAQKTVQSRLFLARFVDLHYDFFCATKDDWITKQELIHKMQVVIKKLEAMLKEWAFGDSLLTKMVAINAFSIEWTATQCKDNASEGLARAFALSFGAALAERLQHGLKKALEKNSPSVRLLLPLLLLCDFVATWPPSSVESLEKESRQFCADAQERYWSQIAAVATRLSPLRDAMDLDMIDMRLKDYDNLCGFAPFDSFVNTSPGNSYISVDDAIRVLDLRASATQESSISERSTSGAEEHPVKLKRFFDFSDKAVKEKRLVCTADGQYRVASPEEDDPIIEDDDEMEDDPIVEFASDEPLVSPEYEKQPSVTEQAEPRDAVPRFPIRRQPQKEDELLVYKQSEGGTGPALLVPGALLLNESSSKERQDPRRAVEEHPSQQLVEPMQPTGPRLNVFETASKTLTGVADVSMQEYSTAPVPQTALGPPPGILPPPGFGPPVAVGPPPGHGYPFAQQGGYRPTLGYVQPSQQPPLESSEGDTVLSMLRGVDVYSQSANPFLVPPSTGQGLFPSQSSASHFSGDDLDGTSLLDSSLLSSMMMDEGNTQPRSRNPFLT